MMLFSKHREVYQNYWNSLSSKQLLKNYFPNLRRKDHESKMSAILVKWFCTMENEYCLEQTKKNFDAVKNGQLRNVSKTINYNQLNKVEISHKTFNPYCQILENSSRNFSKIFNFRKQSNVETCFYNFEHVIDRV